VTPQDYIILLSAKIHPSVKELDTLNAQLALVGDWEEVVLNIIERGMGPLFYTKLSKLSNHTFITDVNKEQLKQTYYRTLSRGVLMYSVFSKAVEALNANGIKVIVLKGAYLSEKLYEDIALRQFSDIDLLIKEADGIRCIKILDQLGFKPFGNSVYDMIREHTGIVHYLPMVLNGVSIEIHIRLHLKSNNYNIKVNEFIATAIPVSISGVNVYALNTYDLLIHLCVHLDSHFVKGGIQFNGFSDIVNVLDVYGADIDWSAFIESCRNHECEKVVFKYLLIAFKYFNVNIPEKIIKQYESSLSENDEKLFLSYLRGFRGKLEYSASTHWQIVRNIKGLKNKFNYFFYCSFPYQRIYDSRLFDKKTIFLLVLLPCTLLGWAERDL
jgi:hypothetical protein